MKQSTIGLFETREDAEKAINAVHNTCGVPTDDISYLYRNTDGDLKQVDAGAIASPTAGEGASSGATIGGALGALAGIVAVAGALPLVGPIVAGGAIAAALGFTALGTAAAGAVAGAAAGGIIGALANMGVGTENAQRYADRVHAGNVLVAVNADEANDVSSVLTSSGAIDVNTYRITV